MATEVMTAPEGRIIHKTYAVLSGAAIPQRVHVTQYDESLPVIACTLYKDGQLYTIPDGASVRMRMNKNGLPVYHEAMGIDDARHVVYLEITAQMTVLYGEFAMVIEVETSEGKTAGTSYLRLIVRQNPVQNPDLDNIPDYAANSNRLTAEGVKKLQDESSTQQKAIEDKGKNTLESIPSDYSTLSGKVDKNTSGISELKEDLTQCEEYVGIEYPEIEPVEGKYYLNTSQASSNSLSHSQILVLHKNDKIVIECCAYLNLSNTIPALVRFNTIDSANPNGTLVQGSYEYETYSYTATDEMYVAFNWRNETGYKVKIYRYQWETVDTLKDGYNILTNFVEVSPGYIHSSTGRVTGTDKKHTELFALRYGETIEIKASGYRTGNVSVLHRYDSDGSNLGPVYAPKESGQKVYCYTETKAIGYYKASSYSEILMIKKYSSPEGIRETICNTKAYERDYLKLLFENAIFIGDSLTRGVLGTTGSINNRISYPYYVGKMTGWNITNAGHGGYTTIQFWENDLKTLNFTDKDVCFIFLGQNGGFTDTLEDDTTISENQTYEDYAETNTGCYCKIIEYIKEQNPNIHIFMLMGAGANATTVLPQIAEKYHLPCLNIYKNQYFYMMEKKVYHPYKSDGVSRDLVHFGKIGYIDLAKSVLNVTFDYIEEHLEDYEYPYPS